MEKSNLGTNGKKQELKNRVVSTVLDNIPDALKAEMKDVGAEIKFSVRTNRVGVKNCPEHLAARIMSEFLTNHSSGASL